MVVSTSSCPWSLVMSPIRRPFDERCWASVAMAVVFPAPRKPPIMIYREGVEGEREEFMKI